MTITARKDLIAATPDDVILIVFSYLEAARDMASLARTCRRLGQLVTERGWRIFARARFPSFPLPAGHSLRNPDLTWGKLAESLTWQSRCWERKSLSMNAVWARPLISSPQRTRHRVDWPATCDALYDLDTRSETLVWSERQNICVRRRGINPGGGSRTGVFRRIKGEYDGYRDVVDDVVRLAIVDGARDFTFGGRQAVLAARASGELELLSIEDDDDSFGSKLAGFHPRHGGAATAGTFSPDQSALLSFDISRSGQVAACNKKSILFYDLGDLPRDYDVEVGLGPSLSCDLTHRLSIEAGSGQGMFLAHVKWIGENTLVLGLNGRNKPTLQYVTLTPSGAVEFHLPFESSWVSKSTDNSTKHSVNPYSITPLDVSSIAGCRTQSLVLSGWRDGTCRLQDLRTPTPFDMVYADNIIPSNTVDGILTYGTERFVGTGMSTNIVQVFDFRWPRTYYHQLGLGCKDVLPYPPPAQPYAKQKLGDYTRCRRRRPCCDHLRGLECTWHRLSRDLYFRPNWTLYCKAACDGPWGSSRPEMIRPRWISLAKGSDLSPHFFIGATGGFVEVSLGDMSSPDPNLSHPLFDLPYTRGAAPQRNTARRGGQREGVHDDDDESGYSIIPLEPSIMETGDGMAVTNNEGAILLPSYRRAVYELEDVFESHRTGGEPQRRGACITPEMVKGNRLDPKYQNERDYAEFYTDRSRNALMASLQHAPGKGTPVML